MMSTPSPSFLRVPHLPALPYPARGAEELLLRDAVPDARQHAVDRADMVGLVLVVAEPVKPPPALVVQRALHHAILQGVSHGF